MSKCDFNKVALLLYRNRTSTWVFSCKSAVYSEIARWHGCSLVYLLHIFRTPLPGNTSGWLLLPFVNIVTNDMIKTPIFC